MSKLNPSPGAQHLTAFPMQEFGRALRISYLMGQHIAFKGGTKKGKERRKQDVVRRGIVRRRTAIIAPLIVAAAIFAWFRFGPKAPVVLPPTSTPEAALQAFWQALGAREFDKCLALAPGLVQTYGGKEQAKGKFKAILKEDAVSQLTPGKLSLDEQGGRATLGYKVTFKSGRKLDGTASLHFDKEAERWLIDGGV